MEGRGVHPTTVTYNALLSAFEKGGEVERAWQLFGCVVWPADASLLPSPSFQTRNYQNFETGRRMRRGSGADAGPLRPDAATYNTLMLACAKGGQISRVRELLSEMQVAGVRPDSLTLTALMTACERQRDWRLAETLFNDLHNEGESRQRGRHGR